MVAGGLAGTGKLRILFSTSGYAPSRGGAESLCRNLAEGLSARGHDVTVITPNLLFSGDFYTLRCRRASKLKRERSAGVEILRVPFGGPIVAAIGRVLSQAPSPFLARRALLGVVTRLFQWRLRCEIARRRPEVVVALAHLHPNIAPSLRAAQRADARGWMMPLLHASDPAWPFAGVKRSLASAHGAFALTYAEAGELAECYEVAGSRIAVTGVGVKLPRREARQAATPPLVLYLGRKTASKGLGLLAEAMTQLTGPGPPVGVALVGARADDTDQVVEAFSALPAGALTSVDDVSESDKQGWLQRCSLLVLPSEREAFGTVILEAWAYGKPVITLESRVAREIVHDGHDGLLAPRGDAGALADAILRLIEAPDLCARLGEAGRRKVEAAYTWPHVLDRVEAALRNA